MSTLTHASNQDPGLPSGVHFSSAYEEDEVDWSGGSPDVYAVGYGKPPLEHRFQKGRSGNPRGRPRKSKDFDAIFESSLFKRAMIHTPDGSRSATVYEALIETTVQDALNGDYRARKLLFDKAEGLEAKRKAEEARQKVLIDQARSNDPTALFRDQMARERLPYRSSY